MGWIGATGIPPILPVQQFRRTNFMRPIMVRVIRLPSDAVPLTERSGAPKSRRLVEIGLPQERADAAIINIIEVMQTIGFALDKSVHAIMYYMPAKAAEPKPALCRLDGAKKHLARALNLIDEQVERPKSVERRKRPVGKIVPAQRPRRRR